MALFDKPISKLTANSFVKPNFAVDENNGIRLSQLNHKPFEPKTKVNGRLRKVTLKKSNNSQSEWVEMDFSIYVADNQEELKATPNTISQHGDEAHINVRYQIFTKNKNGEDLYTCGVNNQTIVGSILYAAIENVDNKVTTNQFGNKEIVLDNKVKWNTLPVLRLTLGQVKDHPRVRNPNTEDFEPWEEYFYVFNNVRAVSLANNQRYFGNKQDLDEAFYTLNELSNYVSARVDKSYGFNETTGINQWQQVENSTQENQRVSSMPSNQFFSPAAVSNKQYTSTTAQTNFGNNNNKMPF